MIFYWHRSIVFSTLFATKGHYNSYYARKNGRIVSDLLLVKRMAIRMSLTFSEDRSRATPTWLLLTAVIVTLSAHFILYLSVDLCDLKKRGKYLVPGYH